ncbi:hypothetical protein OSTOST_00493 [Ostertagia ostertagi]
MDRGKKPPLFEKGKLIQLVESDPYQTCADIAEHFECGESTVRKYLHDLGYPKRLDKWTPHVLTPANKIARFNICSILLWRHMVSFWKRIITCDEKWILLDRFRRSSSWVKKGSQPGVAPKQDLHPSETLITVWWNYKGIIYVDYFHPVEPLMRTGIVPKLMWSTPNWGEPALVKRKALGGGSTK